MAEINGGERSHSHSKKVRVKKISTRIDMTPMVDLAFLLLTFFILTASLTKHQMITVDSPDSGENADQRQPVNEKDILNIVLAGDDKIHWWVGLESPVSQTNYSKDGVRKLLIEKNAENNKLVVLIKPMDASRYQNLVDILDEISITRTARYFIMSLTPEDKELLASS